MRVGLLGTGPMTSALGRRLLDAGHGVVIGSREPERAAALAAELASERGGGAAGTVARPVAVGGDHREAARSDAVIVAVADAVALDVVAALADELADRIVIDLGNPLAPGDPLEPGYWESRFAGGPSLAERLAAAAPGARVVKAFNTVYAELLAGGGRPQTFIASDDEEAKGRVLSLARELGTDPVDVGPLRMARHLEAMAGFEVAMVARGYGRAVSLRLAAEAGG
ncbi:NAD(P)-binding domain-containing protein [Leifsonia sp. F6_8S_P_1B]|uniref:NAD(P)-binding domain-containing protein n=1 Tax=Leifsonia williamsii TaxID=3035919 RepID=A0ABT8K9R5_9MICO|nr:NAD(P)-binding domain-containing protein [Leifsonia williamsii]MDN4613777.1 NAD(P)-binding domain-containing protein [Leifsonia williamsii]